MQLWSEGKDCHKMVQLLVPIQTILAVSSRISLLLTVKLSIESKELFVVVEHRLYSTLLLVTRLNFMHLSNFIYFFPEMQNLLDLSPMCSDWGTPIFLDNTNLYQSYNIYI